MWIYVVTSFTRYSKIGKDAERKFHKQLIDIGFNVIQNNLFARYCFSSKSAYSYRDKIRNVIPDVKCDISVILSGDGQGEAAYHSLNRKRKNMWFTRKPENIEFF